MQVKLEFGLEDVIANFEIDKVSKFYSTSRGHEVSIFYSVSRIYFEFYWLSKTIYGYTRRIIPHKINNSEPTLLHQLEESLKDISNYLNNKVIPNADKLSSDKIVEKLQEFMDKLHKYEELPQEKKQYKEGEIRKKFEIEPLFKGLLETCYQRIQNLAQFYNSESAAQIKPYIYRDYIFKHLNEIFSRLKILTTIFKYN